MLRAPVDDRRDNLDEVDEPTQVTFRSIMARGERVTFAILLAGAVFLTVRYATWWFHTDNVPVNRSSGPQWLVILANYSPFIALTLLETLRILQMAVIWIFALFMRSAVTMPAPTGLRIAVMTTIVPSKEPASILEEALPAMNAIRHPEPFDVWILDEEDDPEVRALCERYGAHHFTRHGIEKYNQLSGPFKARTKAGNHNAWRDQHAADYDIVAQMDPDHIATEDFLEKTLGYFRDPDVGFIIAPQVYYRNTDTSWIARGADEANFGFSAITQRGANYLGMPIFIGSNHLARSAALDSVGGYASHIVEDHLTGMEMLATENPRTGRHWKGVYTEDIISLGEGPTRWSSYLSQQLRWAYGLITIVMHRSLPLLRRLRPRQALGFVLIQSYYISVAVILTIGVTLSAAHLFFGVNAISVHFGEWLGHWFPQFAISLAIWYWLQRFYLRDTDRGWGVRAVLVGMGAMVTYTQALVLALFGRPLSYVITPKGEVGAREPLRLFRWQLVSMLISLSALVWAAWHDTGAASIKFWAALNVVQMGLVIATGVVIPGALRNPLSWRWSEALARYGVRVAVPLVAGGLAMGVAAQITAIGPTSRPAGDVAQQHAPTQPAPAQSYTRVSARFLAPGSHAVAFGDFSAGGHLAIPAKVRHDFVPFGPGSVAALSKDVARAAAAGQISMISWNPRITGHPRESNALLQQIASGRRDRYVAAAATALRDTRQTVVLRLAPEMDLRTDLIHPWGGRSPELFITAWRRIHAIFERRGATNVRFAWTPGGYFVNGAFESDRWYPGDAYVDLVGFTAYVYWGWEEWSPQRALTHAYRSPEELILPRYRALLAHGKPVIIPELGIDLYPTRKAEQTAWLRALVDLVDRDLKDLAAIVYFHSPHNFTDFDIDWRLTPAEQQAFAQRLSRSDRIVLASPAP